MLQQAPHLSLCLILVAVLLSTYSQQSFAQKQYKKCTNNITLAFLLPWELDDVDGDYEPSNHPDSIWSNVIAMEAAADMAIDDINQDTSIFPDTCVYVHKANNWDPRYKKNYTLIDSGGFSAIQAIVSVQNHSVVGVFGDYLDSTTAFTSEVLSNFQVPFCGATQTSPTLDDKSNNPYFMRTQVGPSIGQALLSFIEAFDVSVFSIIIGSDDISSAMGDDISATLQKNTTGLVQRDKLIITPEMQAASDYQYPIMVLQQTPNATNITENGTIKTIPPPGGNSSVRYIFIIADSNLTADFYFQAKQNSLVDFDYLWAGSNPPNPYSSENKTLVDMYGSGAYDATQGFVWIKNDITGKYAKRSVDFYDRWVEGSKQNSTKYWFNKGELPKYTKQSYDCVQLLANGLYQKMKEKNWTADDLRNSTKSGPELLPKSFADTGYEGLLHNPIHLDQYGNLMTSYLFITMGSEIYNTFPNLNETNSTYAFATTDQNGFNFRRLFKKPVFYGGSSTPPSAVPPEAVEITVPENIGAVLLTIEKVGFGFLGLSLLFYIVDYIIQRQFVYPPLFVFLLHLGMAMVFGSLNYFSFTETIETCTIQRFLLPIGFGIGYGAIFAKLFHLSRCLENRFERARGVKWSYLLGITIPITVLNALCGIIWRAFVKYELYKNMVAKYSYIMECATEPSNYQDYITYVVYAIDGLLIVFCTVYSHSMKKEPEAKLIDILCKIAFLSAITMILIKILSGGNMLPRILRGFISWTLCIGTLIIFLIPPCLARFFGIGGAKAEDFSFGMIKSGINRETTSLLETGGTLEVNNLGQVYYQKRGVLGWTDAKKADCIIHRRKGQLTVTFSEVHSFVVQAFNVTHIISEGSLFLTSEPEKPAPKAPKVRDPEAEESGDEDESDDEDDADREITITTRTFSIKIIASSSEQAAEIRAQIFGNNEGEGESGAQDTMGGGKSTINQEQTRVKGTASLAATGSMAEN